MSSETGQRVHIYLPTEVNSPLMHHLQAFIPSCLHGLIPSLYFLGLSSLKSTCPSTLVLGSDFGRTQIKAFSQICIKKKYILPAVWKMVCRECAQFHADNWVETKSFFFVPHFPWDYTTRHTLTKFTDNSGP